MADDRQDRRRMSHAERSTDRDTYGDLVDLNVDQLQDLAARWRIDGRSRMGKDELLQALRTRTR
jgi:hypothetical protein